MFSSSIQHYIIWLDKCHLLVHIIVKIPPFGILDELSLSPSATSSSYPWFNDELLFQEPAHIVHFLRILQCHFVDLCCTFFFSNIPSLRYHDTNRIWILVRYDGWDNFPGVIMLVLWWHGNMMAFLAPLAGGPIIIISFARIIILPRGNCMTYFISCSWWIICVSKVWPLIETPYHCYLEAWLWYPARQQEHWRCDA